MTDEQQRTNRKRAWHLDDCLEKLHPQESLSSSFAAHSRLYIKDNDVTDEMLLEGYAIMAHSVKLYGDQYLPIFERLHSSLQALMAAHRYQP